MRAPLISLRTLLVGLFVVLAVGLGATAAQAQTTGGDYTTQPPTSTGPTTTVTAPAAQPVQTQVKNLPVTGADVTGLAVIGFVLLASGAAVLTVRRRASR